MKAVTAYTELYGKLVRLAPCKEIHRRGNFHHARCYRVTGDLRLKPLVCNNSNPELILHKMDNTGVWLPIGSEFVLLHAVDETVDYLFARILHPDHGIMVMVLTYWGEYRHWDLVAAEPGETTRE